ncbi:MAG: LuxR C-terminal-related transcriptional regulator [Castellaniella sp.]|uniref:response regulator transcription factor n=1 Tax=Castellaniella sp. TaxID=1955812 RepID=UPI003C73D7A5
MVTITVVEPNTLLRLGLLNLLKTLDCPATSRGIDYAQLFDDGTTRPPDTDLMLLSVPTAYDHVKELTTAAQQRFTPQRILLLSDIEDPPHSLLNLSPALAGYICKFAPQDVLRTSIMLVLAGGKCFPRPAAPTVHTQGASSVDGDAAPRRRWYDHDEALPCPPDSKPLPSVAMAPAQAGTAPAPTTELARQEAGLLRLTPRQYDILALMAKGYPLKRISRELAISMATVKTHTEALYLRLGINSRNAAVYTAMSRGATLGCWRGPQDPADPPSSSDSPADDAA